MVNLTKTTKSISVDEIKRNWHLINLEGKILGRAVSEIARLLQGKHKTNYTTNLDMGDNVVIINAGKVVITGKKAKQKQYTFFSGYPGGLRRTNCERLLKRNPDALIRHAVTGMLPKNKLRKRRLARLFVFNDASHTYSNQLLKEYKLL